MSLKFLIVFGSSILEKLKNNFPKTDVVFVGGFSNAHGKGTAMLEEISERVPVEFWGYGVESLAEDSPTRKRYNGEVWGLQMYQTLRNAKVTLSRHIDADLPIICGYMKQQVLEHYL